MFRKLVSALLSTVLILAAIPMAPVTVTAESAPGNIDLSRKAAGEGMVLLENKDNVLPLPQGAKISLFGRGQINFVKGGTGSGDVTVAYVTNVLQGFRNKQQAANKVIVDEATASVYSAWVSANPGSTGNISNPEMALSDTLVSSAAQASDYAVVVISRNSGEGSDRTAAKGDYYLKDDETAMLTKVSQYFDKIIVVMNVGGMMDMNWIPDYPKVKSVLMAWQPGMEGGNAVADVLCGDVNPSGKLTDTFAKSYDYYPSSSNFGTSGKVSYREDIYVGYRYFATADPNYELVNYEFGYGKSYSDFTISDKNTVVSGDNIIVSAKVKNNGPYPGKEVLQVYYSAPAGLLNKPAFELAAFKKTKLLAVGEEETLTMSFPINDMASYDDMGKTAHKSAYVMEAGDYNFYVGNSIKDATKSPAAGKFTLPALRVTEQLTEILELQEPLSRLVDPVNKVYEYIGPPKVDYTHEITPDEAVVINPEQVYSNSDAITFENIPNTTGKCVAFFNNGADVVYKLEVAAADQYIFRMRYANGYGANANALSVYVNDVKQNITFPVVQTGQGSANGEWYNFVDSEKYLITLPEGECYLKLVSEISNGPNLGAITIAPYPGTLADHIIYPDTDNVFSALATGYRSANIRVETAPSQEQCIAYFNNGEELRYTLNVEEAGKYLFSFTYANGRAALSNVFDVLVDGVNQNLNIQMIQTGDGTNLNEWYNKAESGKYSIELPQGDVTLTLRSKSAAGNLYSLKLVWDDTEAVATAYEETAERELSMNYLSYSSEDSIFTDDKTKKLLSVYNGDVSMDEFLDQMSNEELAYLSAGHGGTISGGTGSIGNLLKYGIPPMDTADGPAGIRLNVTCTAWPMSTSLASSWDMELVEQVGQGVGTEALINGVDVWLAPGMNIHRNPRCGRNFEYYSEDPLLTGKTAAAMVKGVQSKGVGNTIKHFFANNQETNRNSVDTIASERAYREIYLKGFEIAIKEADPFCVMSSYNLVNGTETSERYDLLTTLLRGEWGFRGLVMTDWSNNSNIAREAAAGNDVKMPDGSSTTILNAIAAGTLTRDELLRNITNVMNVIMRSQAFKVIIDNPSYYDPKIFKLTSEEATRIKASDYAEVTGTAATEATGDVGGGLNMGWLDAGSSMTYYIDVKDAGYYNVALRIASNAGAGRYQFTLDGDVIADNITMINTGGWQNWTTLPEFKVSLPAGEHFLKLNITAGGSNLNWIQLTYASPELSVNSDYEIALLRASGGDPTVYDPEFSFKNKSASAANVSVYAAAYDQSGRLAGMNVQPFSIAAGATERIKSSLVKPQSAVSYKFFIWDGGFVPLTGITSLEEYDAL